MPFNDIASHNQAEFETPKFYSSQLPTGQVKAAGRTSCRSLLAAVLMASGIAACAPTASQGPAPIHQVIIPAASQAMYDDLHFAPAVRAGDFLFLSGVVAGSPPGTDPSDEVGAYERAFKAIELFLKEAGGGWENVVELETFHTDLPAQVETFAAVKDRYIKEPYPAWTAIDIDRLYPDNAFAEIKVVAYLAAPRTLSD